MYMCVGFILEKLGCNGITGMYLFWLLSIVIQQYKSIKTSLKKIYMENKERIRVERAHHLWIQWQDFIVLI